MDAPCNATLFETQMNSTIFHLVKMVTMSVSYTLNTLLSVPLLLVITYPPSLLRHTRFQLLTHLLLCDNLHQLVWTIKAVLFSYTERIPVAVCMILCAVVQACSLVDLFLSTAMAVDRFVAVKWPLRYEFLMSPRRRIATIAVIWTLSLSLTSVSLCITLTTIPSNFSLPRCRALILTPCISATSALFLYCTVVTAVVTFLCYLTMVGCFCLIFQDMHKGLLCTRRAYITMTLQAAQAILFSVPVITGSYLIPGYLHSDVLDIVTTITYNLGVTVIPLVYGYRSRELQQRISQATHRRRVNVQN